MQCWPTLGKTVARKRMAAQATNDRASEARGLVNLGNAEVKLGRYRSATDHLPGPRSRGKYGRPADAIIDHSTAHRIATGNDIRHEQEAAHAGLAGAHHALGDSDLADRHYRQALALYRDLGMPEADQIQAELTAISTGPERP